MKKIEGKIEDRPRNRLPVDDNVLLVEMPAARARDENRGFLFQTICLVLLIEADSPSHRVVQIYLAFNHIGPCRAVGILEVGHESGRARIERVDYHLAIGRPCDLDAAIEHILRLRRDGPVSGANLHGLGQEIGEFARIKVPLSRGTVGEEFLTACFESAMQSGYEGQGGRRQDRFASGDDRRPELDPGRKAHAVASP